MKKPRLLIEDWLSAAAIGVECIRERSTGQPPPDKRFNNFQQFARNGTVNDIMPFTLAWRACREGPFLTSREFRRTGIGRWHALSVPIPCNAHPGGAHRGRHALKSDAEHGGFR
jgi:hypothetical protein